MTIFSSKFALFVILFASLSHSAAAATYKCNGTSVNPDIVRYEVDADFETPSFRLTKLFKEQDGSWRESSEMLADSRGVRSPVKISWSECLSTVTKLPRGIIYEWSKGTFARGHMTLDLRTKSGEFLSTAQMGGTVSRRVLFTDCELVSR